MNAQSNIMAPKEKAIDLFDKMSSNIDGYGWQLMAKESSIIAVNEIISISNLANEGLNYKNYSNDNTGFKSYWNEVKKEIELL